MFHILPEDLTVVLLHDWLNVNLAIAACLDAACCNHGIRQYWLNVLAFVRTTEVTAKSPMKEFFAWLQERSPRVEALVAGALNDLSRSPRLPTISSVKLRPSAASSHPKAFRKFLSYFPSLSYLECSGCVLSDHHFVFLLSQPLRCPLRRLRLIGCGSISPAIIAEIVVSVRSTLQELHCDGLDDMAVQRMATRCAAMTVISWQKCHPTLQAATILSFCANNSSLKYISLDSCAVTNALIESIACECAALQKIMLSDRCKTDIPLINALSTAGSIRYVYMSSIWFGLADEAGSGSRVCDVTWHSNCTPASVMAVLSIIQLPIRTMDHQGQQGWVRVNQQMLQMLAEHGSSLAKVEIALDRSITRADIQAFLVRCVNLTNLSLTEGQNVEDEDLRNLPVYCPHLNKLCLNAASKLTDDAVIAALEGLAHNNMKCIVLHGSALLTDAVLLKIDQCCPHLIELSLHGTAVTKEAVLEFLLSRPKPCALKKFTPPTREMREWVKEQVTERKAVLAVNIDTW